MELEQWEKDKVKKQLEEFRSFYDQLSQKENLGTWPIEIRLAFKIFLHKNTDLFRLPPNPCRWLGHQLVLKIIDELLD